MLVVVAVALFVFAMGLRILIGELGRARRVLSQPRSPENAKAQHLERLNLLGIFITYGSMVPLGVVLFINAPGHVVEAMIVFPVIGLGISGVAWFLRGWYRLD